MFVSICSKRKLPECFKVDNKQQVNLQNLEHCQIVILHRRGMKNSSERSRLKHSELDYNARHPILLTAKHPFVQLLLEIAHCDNLHEGTEYVRKVPQHVYWIVGLRNAFRKNKSRCVKCRQRPFEIKCLRRTLKKWCCFFNCPKTRAVLIEFAQTLQRGSFIAAVKRFIARRSYSNTISDNGTKIVAAAKELKEFLDEWDKAKIERDLVQEKIVWKFNPPGVPQFGGIRERQLKKC